MQALTYLGQFALLWTIYYGCGWLIDLSGFPLPVNAVGVLVLFTLLCFNIVKEKHIAGMADFLLRHLVFFFVPIAVGLMEWGEALREDLGTFALALLVSTVLPLFIVAFLALSLRVGPGKG